MATPVNEFDRILQAETSRTLASSSTSLVLSTTTNNVFVDGSGNGTPSVINMVATPIGVYGTIVFTTSPSVSFTVDSTGKILTMNQSAMGSSDVTVTATLTTANGLVFNDSKTVKRVTIGTLGYSGALNATANNTAQGLLANRPAGANGDFYFATDNLTLYQKIGGVWTAASTIGANASNFTGTLGGDNLMWNSGFELRAQAGSNRPSGYSAYNNAGISTTYMDVLGRTGGKAYALRANATTTDTFGLRTNNAIVEADGTVGGVRGGWQPNKTYIVAFKAKKVNGASRTTTSLRWNTAPANVTEVSNPGLSSTWQNYAFRITWGTSVESAGQLYIDRNVASGGSVVANDEIHIDELIVQEGDVYSEWFPSAAEARATADNAAKSVFTPYITYDFTGTVQGWYGENSTGVTANANSITVTAANSDPIFAVDPSFPGAKYDRIRMRVRRLDGNGWDGLLFYGNASHGEDGSYFGTVSPDPTVGGNWVVIEWDMSKSSSPTDWASGNVTHLRIDLGSVSSGNLDKFEIDWISIGRMGVGSDEAMAALSAIADDNILSKGEKSAAIAAWNAADAEWTSLIAQADALSVSRTAYDTAHLNLSNYLLSISPAWNDTVTDSSITGSTWRNKWTAYYDEKQRLLNALASKAATLANWTTVAGRPADDQIRNNLIDLSWWQLSATIPWSLNAETNFLCNSLNDAGVVGPKGGEDVVWYAKENSNDGQQGGGWESVPIILDPTKTYRFVVPIRRKSGTGRSYWGTHNVCDLNTTSVNSNPYFALMDTTDGLLSDRWYLFVGYIYPAGSTGNTSTSAGVWDCKTGQKVLGGTNFTFQAGVGNIYHRAYQFYASNNAEQLFGRPMVNLVDGTEPSLREYFEAGAVLNTAITIGANGTLNGAGGGQVTLPGMGQNTYRVITYGGSNTATIPAAGGFYINGVSQYGIGRSYTVIVLNRSTGAVVGTPVVYDVYAGGSAAANMTSALNALGPDKVVVVMSADEPQTHRSDSGLDTAMYRCGASRAVFGSTQFQYRSAYVLIGIPGCGEGNGAEAYQGTISNDPNAWVDVSFSLLNGSLVGVTANYTPRSLTDYGYTGDLNATSDITLIGYNYVTVTGNRAVKVGGAGAWDSQVKSKEGFAGGAYASAKVEVYGALVMFGLNTDPDLDAGYASIDFAIYAYSDGNLYAFASGGNPNGGGSIGTYAAGDVLGVLYDGTKVYYLKNGAVLYSYTPTRVTAPLYFDSSFATPGAALSNIRFGPLTSNNWADIGGTEKPENNATVGAPSGTYVGGTEAGLVASRAANGDSAYNAVNDGTNGLAQKLKANAANILSGSGGLATGNLTWDSSGNRTGGCGVGINQRGIVAYNSSGVATFTLDGSTGAAIFYGALSGATGTFAGSLSAVTGTFAGTLTASQVVTTQNLVDNAATDTALVQSTSVALTGRSSSSAPSSNSDYTTLVTYSFTPSVTGVVTVHYTCFVHYTDTTGGGGTYGHDVSYIKVDIGGFSASDNTQRLNNGQFDDTFTGAKRLSVTAGVATTIYFRCSVYMSNMTAVANNIEMIIEIIKK